MVKQILWKSGVAIAVLGGLTSSRAQEKPSQRPEAEGEPPAGQAEAETPRQKVAKRKLANEILTLKAFIKKVESHDQQEGENDLEPRRANTSGTMTRKSRTCLICRLTQVDTASAGQTTTNYEENACSRWYVAKVEPKHAHVWEESTCTVVSNLDGSHWFVKCNPGHFSIWQLNPETQLAVYQHFKSPAEARDLFLSLADAKTCNDRLERDKTKGHLIVDALEEWEAAEFPGTWKEWWQKWYAEHVKEHKEYLTWLQSHSHLSFSGWQRLRDASRRGAAASAMAKK
jgi:hypothetical protein